MAIITPEQLRDYLRIEVADEYPDLVGVVATVEDLLESICGRKWEVASGSSTRYYSPRAVGQDMIRIHDATAVTAVTDNGVALSVASSTVSGYQLEPINAMDWTGEARPYETIRYINNRWTFDGYRATVGVTATWGWAAIPEQIKRAALVLGKDVWTYRDQPDAANLDQFLRDKARMLVGRYRREEAKAGIGGPK